MSTHLYSTLLAKVLKLIRFRLGSEYSTSRGGPEIAEEGDGDSRRCVDNGGEGSRGSDIWVSLSVLLDGVPVIGVEGASKSCRLLLLDPPIF